MDLIIIENHTKQYSTLNLLTELPGLDLEIPGRASWSSGRTQMDGRITGIKLSLTTNFVRPENSRPLTVNVETTRVKKNGALSAIRPETHSFNERSVAWARPYWAESSYSFEPLLKELAGHIAEFTKAVEKQ